jgi:hypothetical protein
VLGKGKGMGKVRGRRMGNLPIILAGAMGRLPILR